MINLTKPQRIIFQPTFENSEKLKKIAANNGTSVSTAINLILNSVDESLVFAAVKLDGGQTSFASIGE